MDYFHTGSLGDPELVQEYFGAAASGGAPSTDCWEEWRKPQGIKVVSIALLGAGAGGGGGASAASGNRGGGGGGGGAASSFGMWLADTLPDTMFVYTRQGGEGGGPGVQGTVGAISYVSTIGSLIAADVLILKSGTAAATGGGGATTGVTGAQGVAESAMSLTVLPLNSSAMMLKANTGVSGGAGGVITGGTGNSLLTLTPFAAGAGGGSCNASSQNGGSVGFTTAIGPFNAPSVAAGLAAGIINGGGGIWNRCPWWSLGGGGGASIFNGTGGTGGNGGPGMGGGGGGAGVTAGNGGRGGDGYCLITCW